MATIAQIRNIKPTYHRDIELRGIDLFCKGGFSDGDILDEHLWGDQELENFDNMLHDLKPDNCTIFGRISTIALVELYLLPLFDRPLTLYFANYCHNACRVEEDQWWPKGDWAFEDALPSVTLESNTVYSMLYSMRAVFTAWLAGEPLVFPACLKQTAAILASELKVAVTVDQALVYEQPLIGGPA